MGFEKAQVLINRWRHTLGFGVHSPAAFAFIKTIIRCPYAYYADAEIKSRQSRILHRIAARAPLKGVYFDPDITNETVNAVRMADSRLCRMTHPGEMKENILAVIGSRPDARILNVLAAGKDNIIYLSDLTAVDLASICSKLNRGFLLHSPKRAILVTSDRMEFVSYDINL